MPNPYSGQPSLDDARARVARASEHIARLESEIQSALQTDVGGNSAVSIAARSTGIFEDTTHSGSLPNVAPPIVSILVGETVYNLRAALDYLVYELFCLNTGKTNSGTKFLIETSEEAWDQHFPEHFKGNAKGRKKLWLHKLTPAHQTALKGLQPFNGCKWPLRLRTLSNFDKHRFLNWVGARFLGRVTITSNTADRTFTIPSTSGLPVGVKGYVAGEVTLREGAGVVETVHELQKQVANVIEAFDPDFQ